MSNKFVAFDIETSSWPESGKWEGEPLGISCAVTKPVHQYADRWYGISSTSEYMPKMLKFDLRELVQHLKYYVEEGYKIVTWNGNGFDFRLLAIESGMRDDCISLNKNHIDIMYQFFCIKGFPVGLNNVAIAMGIGSKPDGVSGDKAPQMWADGRNDEVLDYCEKDTELTLDIANSIQKGSHIKWKSKGSDRINDLFMGELLTVNECSGIPLPDTSWMDKPWLRSKFTGWMDNHG